MNPQKVSAGRPLPGPGAQSWRLWQACIQDRAQLLAVES